MILLYCTKIWIECITKKCLIFKNVILAKNISRTLQYIIHHSFGDYYEISGSPPAAKAIPCRIAGY